MMDPAIRIDKITRKNAISLSVIVGPHARIGKVPINSKVNILFNICNSFGLDIRSIEQECEEV